MTTIPNLTQTLDTNTNTNLKRNYNELNDDNNNETSLPKKRRLNDELTDHDLANSKDTRLQMHGSRSFKFVDDALYNSLNLSPLSPNLEFNMFDDDVFNNNYNHITNTTDIIPSEQQQSQKYLGNNNGTMSEIKKCQGTTNY